MVATILAMRWPFSDIWNDARYLEAESALFTLILIVGATLEYWEELRRLAFQILKVLRFRTLTYERPVLRKLALHSLAPILVVTGIAGELVFETRAFIVEDLQTTNLSQEVMNAKMSADGASADARQAKTAAGDAKIKADAAATTAGEAQTKASNAFTTASGARAEADTYANEIVSAKNWAADAVSRLAGAEQQLTIAVEAETKAEAELKYIKTPRSIIQTDKLVAALKPFSGTEYVLNVFADDEAIQFTKQVAKILDAAGWVRKQPAGLDLGIPALDIVLGNGPAEHVPECVDTGISLRAHAKESLAVLNSTPFPSLPKMVQAADTLAQNLGASISPPDEHNVMQGIMDPKQEEGIPLSVCVGKKP